MADIKSINGNPIVPESVADGAVGVDGLAEDVVELLDNKADIDGYYSQLTAGLAENLIGRGDAVPAEYLYRTAGGTADIEDGIATIDCIKGNTLVWNQMYDHTKRSTITSNGVTVTNNNDGSFTISGTATDTTTIQWHQSANYTFKVGHKYLLTGMCPAGGSMGTYRATDAWSGTFITTDGIAVVSVTTNDKTVQPRIRIESGVTINGVCRPQIFDLTLMFGAGNEPSTVAEFEAMFPLPYYPYSAPKMLPVDIRGIETVGFNLLPVSISYSADGKSPSFDKAKCVQLIAGNQYQLSIDEVTGATSWRFLFAVYHMDGEKLTGESQSESVIPEVFSQISYDCYFDGRVLVGNINDTVRSITFTAKENVYLHVMFRHGDTTASTVMANPCLHLVWSGNRNGEYEPYWSQQRGVDAAKYFSTGMKRAGSVYDELTAEKAIQRVGVIDLGTLTWGRSEHPSGSGLYRLNTVEYPLPTGTYANTNLVCPEYSVNVGDGPAGNNQTDMSMCGWGGRLWVRNDAYTTAADFKAAMSGVMLYYELAEQVETEIDPPLNLSYKVSDFGTERIVVNEEADAPQSAPVPMKVEYGINAVDTILKLPKEYQSHKSMGQFAEALESSFGVEITEAWDDAHGRYNYDITEGWIIEAVNEVTELVSPMNVFNKDDLSDGFMDNNGAVSANQSYKYTTYYIAVSPGDVVNATSQYGMRCVAAYDADKNVVKPAGAIGPVSTYTVPEGVSYIRLCAYNDVIPTLGVCINAPAESSPWFEPYYKTKLLAGAVGTDAIADQSVVPAKTSFLRVANLHDRSTDTEGKYVDPANGGYGYNASYNATDFIRVTAGETLYMSTQIAPQAYRFVAAYDGRKTIVPSAGAQNGAHAYLVPEGIEYVRISYNSVYEDYCISTKDTYYPYGEYIFLSDDVIVDNGVKPVVVMPKEVCVAVGRTVEIYNSQVCINVERFHVRWNCQVGYQFDRKLQIVGTAANVGTYTATMTLYDDMDRSVYVGTTTIKIVSDGISALKVVPIGDSLTNKKAWLTKVNELNSGIQWVGTRWSATTAQTSTYGHEGRSGATVNWYVTNSTYTYDPYGETTANPFWNPTTDSFDFDYYKTTYNIEPDAVQIFLGTNGLGRDNSVMASKFVELINGIRASDQTIPIYIVNTLYYGSQDGIAGGQRNGATDGQTGSFRGYYKYGQDTCIVNLINVLYDAIDALEDENIHFIPIAFTHDNKYNFGAVETPVNPHATQTELMPTEAVHPQAQGYYQMADVIYSTFCAYQS